MHRETRPVTVHTRRLTIRETHDSLGSMYRIVRRKLSSADSAVFHDPPQNGRKRLRCCALPLLISPAPSGAFFAWRGCHCTPLTDSRPHVFNGKRQRRRVIKRTL
jgi:hypothetical protein